MNAEPSLESIRGYLFFGDNLATSGMPEPAHFAAMRAVGFEVVINLALPTSDFAMPDEGALVTGQGMTYVHLPVKFDAPTREDFERFTRLMDLFSAQRVFVHCAANMRVSAFVFLHRMRTGAVERLAAERDLKVIWEPDAVWRGLINRLLAEWSLPPLD